MGLFSVIKYPITNQFLEEDLNRLPQSILSEWWQFVNNDYFWHSNVSNYPISKIHSAINQLMTLDMRNRYLEKLKELIRDYDE